MSELDQNLNPYMPPPLVGSDPDSSLEDGVSQAGLNGDAMNGDATKPASLGRTAVRWLLVCTFSAVPSFFYGMAITDGQVAGMLTGILIFVVAYTWLDFHTATRPWRRNRRNRRTLRIVYGTRIVISILLPIGWYIDLICGVITVSLTQPLTHIDMGEGSIGFLGTLLTTLVQGCILNVVLGIYALLVLLAQIVFAAIRGPR